MDAKSAVLAIGVASLALTGVAMALNSSAIPVNFSTGAGIEKNYTITVTPTYIEDPSNPSKINFVNNLPPNLPVNVDQPVSFTPGVAIYTVHDKSLKGKLQFAFTVIFPAKTFTNSYEINIDEAGNISNPIPSGDLSSAQNGIVCEFKSVSGKPPVITLECQDLL